MVDVRVFLEYVNILFESIIWAITSFFEKYANARFSSDGAKYCCYYAA